jgi:hypothetical protein
MKGHLETDTFFHIVANAYCCQENRGYTFRHVLVLSEIIYLPEILICIKRANFNWRFYFI